MPDRSNGAGKSTFFKCLTGQLTPTEGSVRIGDVDTTGYQPYEIARLGVGIKTQIPMFSTAFRLRRMSGCRQAAAAGKVGGFYRK